MFGYYLSIALRSLRQNIPLTTLMIIAVGVGIGASMTTLSIFRAMAGDPIPEKSGQLFVVQIDNFGPAATGSLNNAPDRMPRVVSYTDAMALMRAHAARQQEASYFSSVAVGSPKSVGLPLWGPMRATFADFFTMFDVPFEYGAPWSAAEDAARAPVVVISRQVNDRLFGGTNSIGLTVTLNNDAYRVVGVIQNWNPVPRFYALGTSGAYGFLSTEQIFVPFETAIARNYSNQGGAECPKSSLIINMGALLRSECDWVDLWVELPDAAAVRSYRTFLSSYAAGQHHIGRFNWVPRIALRNVRQWLAYNRVVTDDVDLLLLVSFAFLLVCLLNAVVLMLAKFMARSAHVSIRRALGANRRDIFKQCLLEAGLIGVAGAVLGVVLSFLGLLLAQRLFIPPIGTAPAPAGLTRLDGGDVFIAIVLSVGATLLAGLYPTWRAAWVQPAWQLKVQ